MNTMATRSITQDKYADVQGIGYRAVDAVPKMSFGALRYSAFVDADDAILGKQNNWVSSVSVLELDRMRLALPLSPKDNSPRRRRWPTRSHCSQTDWS